MSLIVQRTPDEVDEIKKTLDLLMNDGDNLNISAEDLTQILQYTKRLEIFIHTLALTH
jgi:hypothetical protein